jgi:hypothetical protein
MAKFPTAIDDASSLYAPVDAFSTRQLETTASAGIGAGDSSINVASTAGGFAAAYGVLSIDDELIVYTGKTASAFTGCQRGAFGTQAAAHQSGATVRANMVAGFITALQSAILAIEGELGTAAARNYVRKDGTVTITGIKTFQEGAEFGSGVKAGTGLVRLPNNGALKWRKADNSGDLGMALNAVNHLAVDAIIDFAPGQTFGAFSYPDASTTVKGIVQVDAVGGLAVNAGVLSLAASGVSAGTYTKVTVDAKGRVTGGAALSGADLPAHQHVAGDVVSGVFTVARGGTGLAAIAADRLLCSSAPNTLAECAIGNGLTLASGVLALSGEGGPFQTVGGAFENMAKFSEDFSAAIWDKNGGSCSITANAAAAPDGSQTADQITASTATPIIQQQIAGLASGGTYTFYIWARVASGARKVSLAIVDNPYAAYLGGPSQVTLTTVWQRFKITGTLTAGQTGLWIVVRQYASNGDDWTSGSILLWGACLQQGNDPRKGYARTWAFQTANVAAGVACGPLIVSAPDSAASPFKVRGPGSNLADHTLFEVTAGGELVIAGGAGNGYRFADLMAATNPSGWSGVIKVKTPAGATAGYLLLYSNP